MKFNKFLLVLLVVVVVDQISKLLVYNYMEMGWQGEVNVIGGWFKLHYILNPGMAFGITLFGKFGKLFLSLFRIIAISGLFWFFFDQIKQKAHPAFLFCLALILGGAVGNAIDSIFYGVLLEGNVIKGAATPWLHGQVIDMLYFPLFDGTWPQWVPKVGGRHFLFFSAIFNVADSCIFIGAVSLLLFHKQIFSQETEEKVTEKLDENLTGEITSESPIISPEA